MSKKLTAVAAESTAPASADLIYTVDVSDTSGGVSGTSKKLTVDTLASQMVATQGTTTAKIAPWATMALLRADVAAMPAGFVARSAGHTTAGDGGHGEWLCETGAPGTYTHDGGITIVPSSGTGSDGSKALVRKFTGPIDARWFGFDLTGATNDAAKLTALMAAAASNVKSVKFFNGIYRSDTAVTVPAGVQIEGETIDGAICYSNGTNKNVFEVSVSGVTIRNLTVRGNLTGAGSTSVGSGGHGVFLSGGANRTLIQRVLFQGIGKTAPTATYSGCVWSAGAENPVVDDCFFDDDCCSLTGADVSYAYSTKVGRVTNCISISEHDCFFSGPAVGDDDDYHHIITGNMAFRTAEHSRSAVLASYGKSSRIIVTNNILSGFMWHGVYLNQNGLGETDYPLAGGAIVAHNLIMHCGGVGGAGGFTSGVNVNSTMPVFVHDNLIWYGGYDLNGDVRTGATPFYGVRFFGRGSGHHAHHNTIYHSRDGGIALDAINGSGTLENVTIDHNYIIEHQGVYQSYAIYMLAATNSDSYFLQDIRIADNTVTHSTNKGGMLVAHTGSSTILPRGLRIERNTFKCTHGTNTTNGYYATSGAYSGRFMDNVFDGYGTGFITNSGTVNRVFPDLMIADRNEFRNCGVGIQTYSTYNQIFFNTVFKNCTTRLAGNARNGRHLGHDASGNILVEVFGSAAPTGGGTSWLIGDRWTRTEGVAIGASLGAVVTTAGGPGTWTPLANL
jgi:hypothetical protein